MLLIRDVFRCKPGKARLVAEKFKRAMPAFEEHDGFRNGRVMLDYVADYWTVVVQAEVENLEQFDRHMQTYGSRPEVQTALAGYAEHVDEGHREIFRII